MILFFTHRFEKRVQRSLVLQPTKMDINQNYDEATKSELKITKTSRKSTQIPFRATKLALCGLCMAAYFTGESGYFPYSSSMLQYMEIRFSAPEASTVTSILSLTFTIGPLITALVSLKMQIDNIVSYHYGIVLTGIAVIYFGQHNRNLIYVGSAILGYGFSSLTSGIYAFIHRHLKLNDRVASIFSFTSGSLSLVIPIIVGFYLESNPLMLIYLLLFFVCLSLTLFVTVRIWVHANSKASMTNSSE